MDDEGIAVLAKAKEFIELGPFGVLARGFVREDPVQLNIFELALSVLVQAADPDVSDALPGLIRFLTKSVRLKSKMPSNRCQ